MMSTHKTSSKTYLFEIIAVKEGPYQSPKHSEEASVTFDSKAIYINKSNWCIKGKDIDKMDVQGSTKLIISTTKGTTYTFQEFLGDDASWQEFRKKLEKVYSRKTNTPKEDSFSNFIKGSSRLGLGSPRRQRLAPTKVVTDKKTSPRRPQAVFGRGRQRPLLPSLPWDIEDTTNVHDTESDDKVHDFSPPQSPVKRPTASPKKHPVQKRPVDFSDDELEEAPVQRALIRKRRLVIEDESSDDEEEFGQDLPITTPQANRVVSPRLFIRSVSPQRTSDELDKNQTTFSGFFTKKNVENKQMSSVKRELELTPRKSSVKLVSTPTRLSKSSTGSSHKRSLQQKGWLSPGNDASRGRKMERFGILSAGLNDDESDFKAKDQVKSRSYSTNFGSSTASFVFNKDADRETFAKHEDGQGTPKIPVAFSSPASPMHSPLRSRLSLKKVSRSPVSKHAINDLTKSQTEPDLRYNQYSGLRNLGNTCYMNACLQMICTLPNLIKSLHDRGGALTKSLTGVAKKLQDDPVRAVDPHAVKEAMDSKTDKFLGYEQRDAHEFLSDLIDSIHEEVHSEKSKPSEAPQEQTSPMDDFLLTVRVCLTCASCGYSRSKEETYRHLSVDIISGKEGDIDTKATVEKGLGKFFEEEIREIKCEKCDDGTHATQTMQMIERPKSLVLHLKRFIFVEVPIVSSTSNDENKSPNSSSKPVPMQYVFQKNKEQVQLSESLSLNPFFMKFPDDEATPLTGLKNEYKLQSIVHHIGARASSGHYTADAVRPAKAMVGDSNEEVKDGAETAKLPSTTRDSEKQSWVTFDDTTSYITSLDKILSTESKERTAYMLLYSLDES